MKIERRERLSVEEFVHDYLSVNRPVVVTDAMQSWKLATLMSPKFLTELVGDESVMVYDQLFKLVDVCLLKSYIAKNFGKPETVCHSYVRAYSQLRPVEFTWADPIFNRLQSLWDAPYFLPQQGYVIPFLKEGQSFNPAKDRAPYRGLFVSAKGARTRLHRDPFTSTAILCQFSGTKRILMWSPDVTSMVMKGEEFFDPQVPNDPRFPLGKSAPVAYEDTLTPGETVFFPGGWFHDVTSESDSISITWNFVHRAQLPALINTIRNAPGERELEVAKYFLEPRFGNATPLSTIADGLSAMVSSV